MNEIVNSQESEHTLIDYLPVAKSMVDAIEPQANDTILIQYDISDDATKLAYMILDLIKANPGTKIEMQPRSLNLNMQEIAEFKDEAEATTYILNEYQRRLKLMQAATKVIIIERNNTDPQPQIGQKLWDLWCVKMGEIFDLRMKKPWTYTTIPTPEEAKIDKVTYDQLRQRYVDACRISLTEVRHAQKILIDEILNPASEIIIEAGQPDDEYHTRLEMNIAGMTFANSTRRNIPGTEVFSAPKAGSCSGIWGIPYPVYINGKVIQDLILNIKDGEVIGHKCKNADDQEWVAKQLEIKGAKVVSEIGFGTNSSIANISANPLFVEKMAGSVHIALGYAYEDEKYDGEDINFDNGARSTVHWDITRDMRGGLSGSKIWVDGKIIQEDGFFLDDRLSILNPAVRTTDKS